MLSIKVSSSTYSYGVYRGGTPAHARGATELRDVRGLTFPEVSGPSSQEPGKSKAEGKEELGKKKVLHTMGGEELCPFGMVGTC